MRRLSVGERRILTNQLAIMQMLTATNDYEKRERQLNLCAEIGRTQATLQLEKED